YSRRKKNTVMNSSDPSAQRWMPSRAFREGSNLTRYNDWLRERKNLRFEDYDSLWTWSAGQPAAFWGSMWEYFGVLPHTPCREVMSSDPMRHTRWFEGSTLNHAERVFRNSTDEGPALLFSSETGILEKWSWKDLEDRTAARRAFLKK